MRWDVDRVLIGRDSNGKQYFKGEPCSHRGCMAHVSHPCEGCGRQWGQPQCHIVDGLIRICHVDRPDDYVTVRDCIDCGCLVPGGPTRCKRCADESAQHVTDGSPCWCEPREDEVEGGTVVVHRDTKRDGH